MGSGYHSQWGQTLFSVMEHGDCLTLRVGSRQYSYSVVSSWQPPEDICMSILRALLSLILVTIVLPTIAQAGGAEYGVRPLLVRC